MAELQSVVAACSVLLALPVAACSYSLPVSSSPPFRPSSVWQVRLPSPLPGDNVETMSHSKFSTTRNSKNDQRNVNSFQCFDTVGWATGRTSSLEQLSIPLSPKVLTQPSINQKPESSSGSSSSGNISGTNLFSYLIMNSTGYLIFQLIQSTDQLYITTRYTASTSIRWHFAFGAIVIATKPMHRLQICPVLHNNRAPPNIPSIDIWVCAVVWECGERQTDTLTAVTNVHFASVTPQTKRNKLFHSHRSKTKKNALNN